MCDPAAPHSFRTDPAGGGVLMDLGSHIVSLARFLVGPIALAWDLRQKLSELRDAGNEGKGPLAQRFILSLRD